jgi:hypothetical protein
MPTSPRFGVIHEKQGACNDAISSLRNLQRREGRESDLLTPSEFTRYLKWHVISENLLTGTTMKEETVRLISKWWWAYFQNQFQLRDSAFSNLQLDTLCIDPLVHQGMLIRTPPKHIAQSTNARRKLGAWLRRTYFTDNLASQEARAKDSVDEMMKAFVDSLEPEIVSDDDEW